MSEPAPSVARVCNGEPDHEHWPQPESCGGPGIASRLDFSTNLADWVPLTSFVSTNSLMYLRDTGATNSGRRFYRAVVP